MVSNGRRGLLAALLGLVASNGLLASNQKDTGQLPRHMGQDLPETPLAVVQRLFDTHVPLPEQWQVSLDIMSARPPDLLTDDLTALWREAMARAANMRALPTEFNPFTLGRDAKVNDLNLTLSKQQANEVTVLARFKQGHTSQRVTFTLRPGFGGWRVDDVAGQVDGQRWTLQRALTAVKAHRRLPRPASSPTPTSP